MLFRNFDRKYRGSGLRRKISFKRIAREPRTSRRHLFRAQLQMVLLKIDPDGSSVVRNARGLNINPRFKNNHFSRPARISATTVSIIFIPQSATFFFESQLLSLKTDQAIQTTLRLGCSVGRNNRDSRIAIEKYRPLQYSKN